MGNSNADRFLQAMVSIENFLKGKVPRRPNENYTEFGQLVQRYPKLPRGHKDDLREYAELRNAIVHNRRDDAGRVIADPRDDTVAWVENLLLLLTEPPLVRNVLKLQPPHVFDEDSPIEEFLELVRDADYSQSPVRDASGGLWLVTTNAVTRWVAKEYEPGQGVALLSATVGDMKGFTEPGDTLMVKPKDLTVIDAVKIFGGEGVKEPPSAIVLTHSGDPTQTLLGICSRADVASLLQALEV